MRLPQDPVRGAGFSPYNTSPGQGVKYLGTKRFGRSSGGHGDGGTRRIVRSLASAPGRRRRQFAEGMIYAEVKGMTLFRSKVWSPVDIASLKWSCIFLGMIVGAYLSGFVREYVWAFVIAVILLGIKPALAYFRTDEADK